MKPSEVEDWGKQWKEVKFSASLEIVGICRGRSAANLRAKEVNTNNLYTIFLSDFLNMLLNGDIRGGKIEGIFVVKKRGRNFGIKLKGAQEHNYKRDHRAPYNRPIPDYL